MSNPALWTAIAGVVAAVGGVVGLFVHSHGAKHNGPSGTQ